MSSNTMKYCMKNPLFRINFYSCEFPHCKKYTKVLQKSKQICIDRCIVSKNQHLNKYTKFTTYLTRILNLTLPFPRVMKNHLSQILPQPDNTLYINQIQSLSGWDVISLPKVHSNMIPTVRSVALVTKESTTKGLALVAKMRLFRSFLKATKRLPAGLSFGENERYLLKKTRGYPYFVCRNETFLKLLESRNPQIDFGLEKMRDIY